MAEKAGFHDFAVSDADRRQYPRVSVTSPMWWFSGEIGGVQGIAVEISAGGIQFLLKRTLPQRECSIAFQVNDRKMWAKVSIVRTTQAMHEGQCWTCYGANFEGLLESDFDFIAALGGSPAPPLEEAPSTAPAVSISSLQSNEGLLPNVAREQIVQMLVAMDRLQAVENMYFALIAIHYVGIHPSAEADVLYHRFAVRTRKNTNDGRVVYNTHFLVRDDGLKVLLHE